MHWLRQLWQRLSRISPTFARRRVDRIDRSLADLRAKVRALPLDQQAAFAQEIQDMIKQQAKARNELNDALDDRHDHT